MRTASVQSAGRTTSGGLEVIERASDLWEEKSPEGGNPRSDPVRNDWKARRGARRQERFEL
jgi:hypothetical protein